jgi:DNA polymerase
MRHAINALTEELRRLKASGVGRVSASEEGLEALRRAAGRRPAEVPAPAAPAAAAPTVALPDGDKESRWKALRQQVLDDPVCRSKVRPGKKVVLGVGSLDAAVMFIGEAPGGEEEIQGEPFVGPAGQLLNRMIGGMGVSRADVYIGNIMNWRPDLPVGPDGVQTGNRPPTEAEMAHCLPYIRAQMEIVNPRVLVALGATAAKGLLGFRAFGALGEVRGLWHDYGGRPLMVTYHPSYILRNPTNRTKRLIWEDLLKVMERVSLPISDKQRGFFL